jgi:hypothetical protein
MPDFIATKSDFNVAIQNCLLSKSTQPSGRMIDPAEEDLVQIEASVEQKAYQPYRLPH